MHVVASSSYKSSSSVVTSHSMACTPRGYIEAEDAVDAMMEAMEAEVAVDSFLQRLSKDVAKDNWDAMQPQLDDSSMLSTASCESRATP